MNRRSHLHFTLALVAGGLMVKAGLLSAQDSSFAAMQRRGKMVMGVDQYTSVHKFDDLADGGRIELQAGHDDSAGVHTIRKHLHDTAHAFEKGDFSGPSFVHMKNVPGTRVMVEKRAAIHYSVSELPRGGELRISSADPGAVKAVHEFLAFQRSEHHAAGHEMHDH